MNDSGTQLGLRASIGQIHCDITANIYLGSKWFDQHSKWNRKTHAAHGCRTIWVICICDADDMEIIMIMKQIHRNRTINFADMYRMHRPIHTSHNRHRHKEIVSVQQYGTHEYVASPSSPARTIHFHASHTNQSGANQHPYDNQQNNIVWDQLNIIYIIKTVTQYAVCKLTIYCSEYEKRIRSRGKIDYAKITTCKSQILPTTTINHEWFWETLE